MGLARTVQLGDVSLIRDMWEGRVRKHRQRQRKEEERVEHSALARIEQQWQYRIYCKTLKTTELDELQRYLHRATLSTAGQGDQCQQVPGDQDSLVQDSLVFRLTGDQWTSLPRELQWSTFLTQWHVSCTRISRLPDYLPLFSSLSVLDVPNNLISELPPEIGKLWFLQELNVSYNRLSGVPPELGLCENLKRLELTGNLNLSELPFELSGLKQLEHLDLAENRFISIPVCVLRMNSLTLLDLSNNQLVDLPQDMDRLQSLSSLFIHRNLMSYIPQCLTNISSLKTIVVSGDDITCCPTRVCRNPDIRYIRLCDNKGSSEKKKKEEEAEKRRRGRRRKWEQREEEEVKKDSREKEFMEAYLSSLQDRETIPESTTKVSISCLL